MFRVVIFSSGSRVAIAKLARRIEREVPEATVCGVLLERRSGKTLGKRVSAFVRNIRQLEFMKYAAGRIVAGGRTQAEKLGTLALRLVHAAKPMNIPEHGLDGVC